MRTHEPKRCPFCQGRHYFVRNACLKAIVKKRPPIHDATRCPFCHGEHYEIRHACLKWALLYKRTGRHRLERPWLEPALFQVPSPPTPKIAREFVDALSRTNCSHTWAGFVPSRIGHSTSIDLAAQAVAEASRYASCVPNVTKRECIRSGLLALEVLRTAVEAGTCDDKVLLSVALMALFERTLASYTPPLFLHVRGICAVLASRSPTTEVSEMTRSILYGHMSAVMFVAFSTGTASPLDIRQWSKIEPAGRHSLESAVLRLMTTGYELFARLPRLVVKVRQLREGISVLPDCTICLARELQDLHNQNAESELLHSIKIVKTENTDDTQFLPYSFDFPSTAALEAAIYYWAGCVLLQRLCYRLHVMFPEHCVLSSGISALQENTVRMAKNICMSLQFTCSSGARGSWCLALPFVAVWGAVEDFEVFPAVSLQHAQAWLMQRCCDLMGTHFAPDVPEGGRFANALAVSAQMAIGGAVRAATGKE